ncbi:MAG: Nitrogen regulatory protein P-II [uncultured Truepera sp.]|uniref:Nitrogen regulatory protein P-II n=1 Tax=uncultured Truepera sp. TaxID=543023 RepID=A0A6J4UY18_9DEIN|nr:MAG: Nitrogen regulatory protein P-II [uncultured Truepera sp.]
MKLITAVIRPEMLTPVKEALFAVGVTGITITRVSGHGGEREVLEQVRGTGYLIEFHEKVQLSIAVSDEFVDATLDAIVKAARTGEVGDGKIFVQPIERAVRIRTGEEDRAAVTPVAKVKERV